MTRAIVLSERDNVATVLDGLAAGEAVAVAGRSVRASQAIPAGHKIALAAIAAGEPVVKYGEPIGRASRAVEPGDHVHVHNLQSDRGRGDRAQGDRAQRDRRDQRDRAGAEDAG
jgi:altronate dehydratase small subunit